MSTPPMTRLSISLLCSSFISPALLAQPCVPPPKNLSAWFTFDEPLFRSAQRIPGVAGSALRFDGKGSFFAIPAATPGLNPGEENFTVELWVRTTAKSNIRNIVDKRSSAPTGWLLYIRNGAPGFQVAREFEISDAIAAAYPINDGKWHHIAGVARRLPPQAPQVYVDGRLRTGEGRKITLGNIDNNAPVWLARHHANQIVNRDDVYFAGDIDELSFYRRALTPAEIAALYRARGAGKCRK